MGSSNPADGANSLCVPCHEGVQNENLDYWKHKLAGSHNPDLPVDYRFREGAAPASATRTMVLTGDLACRLRELSLSSEATPYVLFLAAFQVLLMRHTGQRDLLVGTSSASLAGVSDPGMGSHTVVIRGDLSGNPRFIDLIPRVRETVLAAYAHDVPFDLLAGIPGLETRLSARFDLHCGVTDEIVHAIDAG